MKTTGIVRQLDSLGRIVIPIELRRSLGIEIRDPVEISAEGDTILLRKHRPACIFCGKAQELNEVMGKPICLSCLKKLKTL